MRRGLVFSIDAVYALGIAFVVVAAVIVFLHAAHAPDYSFVDSLKTVHDMAEDDTALPPGGYSTTCEDRHAAVYYMEDPSGDPIGYDYGGTGEVEVCAQ